MRKLSKIFPIALLISLVFLNFPDDVNGINGASLSLAPAGGTFTVGSTFTVSIILNTNDQYINAVESNISFPPDKLQVVSPILGASIISVWTNQPQFDNQNGFVRLQGGIPNPGINTSHGTVATVAFRVKSVGKAVIKFLDTSKVLLNDGFGTDALTNTQNGIYDLILPPPAGPIIVSETHPDQTQWYPANTVALKWDARGPADGFSYVLSEQPIDIPDDISEGAKDNVVYRNLVDGLRFFHVKALRNGTWGATSHFALKIDATPPAKFPIEISPSSRTSTRRPLINFATTDALSGVDHYELKIVPRDVPEPATDSRQPFFIESVSPYSQEFKLGRYDIIVRAYDKAGNFQEITQRLSVVTPILQILGFQFLPRWLAILLGLILLALLIYIAYRIWKWHNRVHLQHLMGAIKDPAVVEKLKQLQEKQSQYLKHLIVIFTVGLALAGLVNTSYAQRAVLPSPIITTISEDITNEELLYVGGKAAVPGSEIILYLQSLHDGQTFSANIAVDKRGDWFYSHQQFLTAGKYLVWGQAKFNEELSAPSPQFEVNVAPTAIQFGVSRISFETLYLVGLVFVLLGLVGTSIFIAYHGYHGHKKQKKLVKEVLEAEESIKRGFLILHRDLEAELSVLRKAKINQQLSPDDLEKERRLVADLEWVKKFVEKEVKDIEKLMNL